MTEALNRKGEPTPLAAALTEGTQPAHHTAVPLPTITWHESWIVRAAAMASFILMVGYVSSAFFAVEAIDGAAKLAHDDQIEQTLGDHLESIKRVHTLEQELVVERLRPELAAWARSATPGATIPAEQLRTLLVEACKGLLEGAEGARLTPVTGGKDAFGLKPTWLDRDRLRVGPWVAELPKGQTYEAFKAAEDVRQRYQLVGANLDTNIRPRLIRATTAILIGSFLVLASLFMAYARRFKRRIGDVLEGFRFWSEKDAKFRFGETLTGELGLIAVQFNAMADEVEANRQRSLYLEKIASWQIIARKLAHEIKNPLTPIQMMVSQLKRRYKGGDDPAFAKLLDEAQHIITEEVAGLRRMVDNFSNFARLPEPAPKPTDLVPLCRHVVELQRGAFERHELAFASTATAATATLDEDLIRQVLINLIKNAAEACGETPSKIEVGLVRETTKDADDWVVTVKDNGPGIPPELQERIFEAYFTTKHTGPSPGMGLGLAVCQKIVMDHAGKMTVRSRPGETVFAIRLPRRRKDP